MDDIAAEYVDGDATKVRLRSTEQAQNNDGPQMGNPVQRLNRWWMKSLDHLFAGARATYSHGE